MGEKRCSVEPFGVHQRWETRRCRRVPYTYLPCITEQTSKEEEGKEGNNKKLLKRCSGSRTEGFRNFFKQKGERIGIVEALLSYTCVGSGSFPV